MKRLLAAVLSLPALVLAATTTPVQLLSPTGSTAGQAIVSSGPSSAPAWGNVTATALAPVAANTVIANATGSSAAPTAHAVPSCSTANSALKWTSGTGLSCGTTFALTSGNLSQFTSTTSAQLAGVLSDETGTGLFVLNDSPALAGTPTTPTASTGTSNTMVANTAFVANTLAAPPAIGSGTPASGRFTTLTTTAQSKVVATTTNALSIPNNAFTTVTTWTAALNQGSNFNTSTGAYTAPAAGTYDVRFAFKLATANYSAGNAVIAAVFVNGVGVYQFAVTIPVAATSIVVASTISAIVSCAASDVITVRAFQNSGGAVALDGSALNNWVMISQMP